VAANSGHEDRFLFTFDRDNGTPLCISNRGPRRPQDAVAGEHPSPDAAVSQGPARVVRSSKLRPMMNGRVAGLQPELPQTHRTVPSKAYFNRRRCKDSLMKPATAAAPNGEASRSIPSVKWKSSNTMNLTFKKIVSLIPPAEMAAHRAAEGVQGLRNSPEKDTPYGCAAKLMSTSAFPASTPPCERRRFDMHGVS